jgi:predicted transcriptional regulator
MTLTITPETEAMLLAKAERDGEDINTLADGLLADLLARDQAEEIAALRAGLESSDAGRVRPLTEVAAEMRAKYHLPTHLSDEEVFSGEEGIAHK